MKKTKKIWKTEHRDNEWKRRRSGRINGEKVSVLCLKETRWKGNQARELGVSCKSFYSLANEDGRNGVGIVLSENIRDNVVSVKRASNRVTSMKLWLEEKIMNLVNVYAPQVDCIEEETGFWGGNGPRTQRDTSGKERLIKGGVLNGHVGRCRVVRSVHAGWGVGEMNEKGERIVAFDLVIANTWFERIN